MTTHNIEDWRPAFEAYILTERGRSDLKRRLLALSTAESSGYENPYVQEAWEAWQACSKAMSQTAPPARTGPDTPNNDMVICPTCTSQFPAIPVNIQARLSALENPPAIPSPSHVHCETCEKIHCEGIKVREALPAAGPSPEQIRHARAEGRAEAFNLLTGVSAEEFGQSDTYLGEHPIGDTGDYEAHWNEDKLRELLQVDDAAYSYIDQLDASYWTQQAFIDGLQNQLEAEWLPIGAAESDKDGRYILGWFTDKPFSQRACPDDPPTPWVAAVRWSGNEFEAWSMLGVGGLMPTRFLRIIGPDRKPVGHIR